MAKKRRTPGTRSAYQAHVTTFLSQEVIASTVIDFTERKLRRLARLHADEDVRKLATRMLRDYLRGSIAIAWEEGCIPVYSFLKL